MDDNKKYESFWACEFSDQTIIKKGNIATFKGAWGWIKDKALDSPYKESLMAEAGFKPSKTVDIHYKVENNMTIGCVLHEIEKRILAYIKCYGGHEIRIYFIEGVTNKKGIVDFIWGT